MTSKTDLDYIIHSLVATAREIKEGNGDHYTQRFPVAENPDTWSFAGSYLNRGDRLVLLHHEKQKPVACLLCRITSSAMSEIYKEAVGSIDLCWVEPEYRNTGIAGELVKNAEAWFMKKSIKIIELSYMAKNQGAAQVWEKLHYRPFRVYAYKELK